MKRLAWLGAGFGLGVVAARRARRHAAAAETGGASRTGGASGWLHAHVSAALDEGRREARQREVALRNVLAAPTQGSRDAER